MKGPTPPMQPVHHAKGNFDMSKDEFRRIEKAMAKPEFMGMLNDYMLEISDPKNKEEYDEYLKQLQKEGDLPKELKLVKPQVGFCLKTTISSKKDKGSSQKLFVNCCQSPIVECPTFDVVERSGKKGQNWRLPYSAGKMRYDQSAKKEICTTIDVAFHPHAFQLCHVNPQFQQLVCQTALDGANQQMGERNEIISRDYKVLKNTKCKGGEPALLTVRISGTTGDHIKRMQEQQEKTQQQQAPANLSETQKRQCGEGYESSLYRDILNQKKEYSDQYTTQKSEKRRMDEAAEIIEEIQESNEVKSQPIQAPKYRIMYSYPVQYEDFLDRREESNLKRPIELTLEITLPRVSSIKDISLDIEEKNLVLNVTEKYFLDIQLPYFVLQDDGNAKFDSKKKILRVRLPINKNKLPEDLKPPKTFKEFEEDEIESEMKEQVPIKNNIQKEKEEKIQTEQENNQESLNQSIQFEPLLELTNPNNITLNAFNQQTNEQFIESQVDIDYPNIQVLSTIDTNKIQSDVISEPVSVFQEITVKNNELLSYKLQETTERAFLIFHIPLYDKQDIQTLLLDNQLLILYEDKKTRKYLRVDIAKPFSLEKSTVSLVTDYIVFNIHKDKEEYWNSQTLTSSTDDFETFKLMFDEMTEAMRLLDESKQSVKISKGDVSSTSEGYMQDLDGLEGENAPVDEIQKQDFKVQSSNKTDDKIDLDNKEDTQIIKLREDGISKNILQFIEFTNCPFVFDLD